MINRFREWWWQTQFHPGLAGVFLCPFYFARKSLDENLRQLLSPVRGKILDVGCGRAPYRQLLANAEYIGVDIDTAVTRGLGVADAFYDGTNLPFPEGRFDAVLCSQVLEHVFSPDAFLAELARVLRPGGMLILTVPFVWDEHEQPVDFARYSSFGLRAMLSRNGFSRVETRKTLTDARVLAQLVAAWIYKVGFGRSRALNLVVQLLFIAPVNVFGALAAALLPNNPDFFLDNVAVAIKGS